jgi:hypothetical protein
MQVHLPVRRILDRPPVGRATDESIRHTHQKGGVCVLMVAFFRTPSKAATKQRPPHSAVQVQCTHLLALTLLARAALLLFKPLPDHSRLFISRALLLFVSRLSSTAAAAAASFFFGWLFLSLSLSLSLISLAPPSSFNSTPSSSLLLRLSSTSQSVVLIIVFRCLPFVLRQSSL